MQVKDITGIRFTARWTTQKQGNLPVGNRLLAQIVVNNQGVFTAIAVVLPHGATGKGGQELHRRRVRGIGGHHDGVLHGAVLFELAYHRGHRRGLLANRDVDTLNTRTFLVDDGIDGNGRLAHLAITDNQLALAAADRHHGVDGFQTDLYRLIDGLPGDNTGRDFFQRIACRGVYRTLAVDGIAQGIDHAALQFRAYRHLQNPRRAAAALAFRQSLVVTENNRAHGIAFEVQRHAVNAAVEFDHFPVHHVGQTVNADNAVADGDDRADVARFAADVELIDSLANQLADFRWIQLLHDLFLKT